MCTNNLFLCAENDIFPTVRYRAIEIDAQEAVSRFLNVRGQVSQFLNVPRSGRMPIKSGRVPIYKAARVCSAPTHGRLLC